MSFTVSCKLVRERFGAGYDLSKWVEGVDYVRRRAFSGERVVFRKGFLDGVVEAVEQPVVEARQPETVAEQPEPVERAEPVKQAEPVAQPQLQQAELPRELERRIEAGGSGVYECRVTRMFANQRYVGTDTQGVVYVGGKSVKCGQRIAVSGGHLVLKKAFGR